MELRLWINTGTVHVTVANPDTTNCGHNLTPANDTFSNTCPIMVIYHAGGTNLGIAQPIPADMRLQISIGMPNFGMPNFDSVN